MKVCLILEGCYPYIRGGVSSWAHDYISSNPQIEFVLWTIHASRDYVGAPLYSVPENVVANYEIFLEDASLKHQIKTKKHTTNQAEYISHIKRFLSDTTENWNEIFDTCCSEKRDIDAIVNSEEFLNFSKEFSLESDGTIGWSTAYFGLKSMFLPLMHLMNQEVPEADIYHSAVAGYGGILGSIAKHKTGKPFVLTEHGIYPREREEELVQSDWIDPSMRKSWILSFYNYSRCAYYYADRVTALYKGASEKQIEIGCDEKKCRIVSNGIHTELFNNISTHTDVTVNIGAFVRFAPIKDIKTLIYSFYNLKRSRFNAKLYIMGGVDDEAYKEECLLLIDRLGVSDVFVEGYVNTAEYMQSMDFTILTSISEGQPLAILESLASGRPCVATRVGSCEELLLGSEDDFGPAGICCNPMDIEAITDAMATLCIDVEKRLNMGANGKNRVLANYTHTMMNDHYMSIYNEVV